MFYLVFRCATGIQHNPISLLHPDSPALTTRQRRQPLMPGDHSELEPPLPIPNRTVKRLCADDSADYPCESRSSPGSYTQNPQAQKLGGFAFAAAVLRSVMLPVVFRVPEHSGAPRHLICSRSSAEKFSTKQSARPKASAPNSQELGISTNG